MTTIALLNDVAERADLNNAAVITRAFLARRPTCSCCQFPNNCDRFQGLLHAYTQEKLKLHRMMRTDREDWRGYWDHRGCWWTYEHGEIAKQKTECNRIRRQLNEIWPCQECMAIFNPTRRKALGYTYRPPQGKGFLE